MVRYLGIDYGERRIGYAISDSGGRIAFPKGIIMRGGNPHVMDEFKRLIGREQIERIIVGLPLGFDGTDTEQTKTVREFTKVLSETILMPVEFENEMLTTKIAKATGVSKEQIDASSAAILLQSYLDKYNR